jgi:hypothetical protein
MIGERRVLVAATDVAERPDQLPKRLVPERLTVFLERRPDTPSELGRRSEEDNGAAACSRHAHSRDAIAANWKRARPRVVVSGAAEVVQAGKET